MMSVKIKCMMMLNVIMLNVIMLNVIMLNVMNKSLKLKLFHVLMQHLKSPMNNLNILFILKGKVANGLPVNSLSPSRQLLKWVGSEHRIGSSIDSCQAYTIRNFRAKFWLWNFGKFVFIIRPKSHIEVTYFKPTNQAQVFC